MRLLNACQRLLVVVQSALVEIKLDLILADRLLRRGTGGGNTFFGCWRRRKLVNLSIEIVYIFVQGRNLLLQVVFIIVDLLANSRVLCVYESLGQIIVDICGAVGSNIGNANNNSFMQVI